jgi:hypothetical protein
VAWPLHDVACAVLRQGGIAFFDESDGRRGEEQAIDHLLLPNLLFLAPQLICYSSSEVHVLWAALQPNAKVISPLLKICDMLNLCAHNILLWRTA